MDGLLRFLALDVTVVNSDGYWTRASDYSLYLDPTGVFHVIPHDMNEAFITRGGRPGGRRPGAPAGFGGGRRDLKDGRPDGAGSGNPEEFRGERPSGRRGGFGGGRPTGGSPGHGTPSLDPLIDVDSERMPLRSKILAVPAYRQKYLQYVRTIAENSLDLKNMGPVIQRYRDLLLEEIKTDTRKLSSFDAFVSMTNRPSDSDAPQRPSLYKFLEDRRTFLLAHDEIKRVKSIRVAPSKTETLTVTKRGPKPSIAINEVLASNENGKQDPQGDREDWIEIFNHGHVEVDLSETYLSDDPKNMFKWKIPAGTVLRAGQYLVIWADEDGNDAGLHANFKLSAKGESITLVSRNVLVDRVTFGVQEPDVSSGRLSDPRGPWKELIPTPGAPNQPLN